MSERTDALAGTGSGARPGARSSLRRRLLSRVGAAFAVLLLAMSALLWQIARRGADQTYDLLLSGSALAMLERVSDSVDGPTVDVPYSALEILALARDERVAYRVFTADGATLTGEPGLPLPDGWEPARERSFFDAPWRGALMRFTLQGRELGTGGGRKLVLVQIGQTRGARDAQRLFLFATGAAGLAAVALAGLLFVWFAISRALQPLAAIEADLRRRDPTDLSPLVAEPPREVERLIGAINAFVARLKANREHTEGFIADVAHQTRTSLSALDGQLGLAVDAGSPEELRRRAGRAADQARRTVRLTDQLLAHAMVIHRGDGGGRVAVRPVALVRELLSGMLRDSALRDVALGFDADGADDGADGADVTLLGDPVALREALRNLVDNAVCHGGATGAIDVSVRVDREGRVTIAVDDAGPGIPAPRRAEALGRFVSLDAATAGSGLGLAIVAEVAASHGATLELDDSPRGGLRVALSFPRLAAAAEGDGGGSAGGDGNGGERAVARVASSRRSSDAPAISAAPLAALVLCAGALAVGPEARAETLLVWSATDTDAVAAVIERFEERVPGTDVDYREFQTVELHERVLAAAEGEGVLPDVVLSSAMDLQVDLVNRGLARAFELEDAVEVPDCARWRDELRGFTREPAAIVHDRAAWVGRALPTTHLALADAIRDGGAFLDGRIGTYDVRASGIGYLFATQDATQGQQFQRLTESLGRARARVYCCTSVMIDAVASGELVMAINVIGSYALAATEDDPRIGVHFLDDYNLVMSRTAFVPAGAARPALGERFVGFLLSAEGQRAIAERSALLPIAEAAPPSELARPFDALAEADFLPIRLGPGLLTWLDRLKRARFVEAWEASMLPGERAPAEPLPDGSVPDEGVPDARR